MASLCLEVVTRKQEKTPQPPRRDFSCLAAEDPNPLAMDPSHSGAGAGEYLYQPLLSGRQIRLLLLEPLAPGSSQESLPIRATLHHVEFDSKHLRALQYRALSYEWGMAPKKDEGSPTILLDGRAIRVRKILYDALKSIRYLKNRLHDSDLWLWVDALCINQSDVQERGHQVRLMKRIYQTVEMVLVWLGTGDKLTGLSMSVLNLKVDEFQDRVSRKKLDRDELREIRKICEMRYWRRVWILQEIVLARNYLVISDEDYVPMEKFEKALARLTEANWNWARRPTNMFQLPIVRVQTGLIPPGETAAQEIVRWRNIKGKKSPLIDWLRICLRYGFEATDPRDYVYTLLGISNDCKGKIEPDYSQPATQVYSSTLAVTGLSYGNLLAQLMGLKWSVGN